MIISDLHRAAFFALPLASILFAGCATSPRFGTRGSTARSSDTSTAEEKKDVEPRLLAPSGKALLMLEGVASYYANEFHGKLTSNGETFDMDGLTAAHRTFPFGTKVRVTNLENNKSVIVRVNDRGPFKEGRIIDLSRGAAKEIDLIRTGTVRVKLEVLEWGLGD
jgi:rare lipoprotein A